MQVLRRGRKGRFLQLRSRGRRGFLALVIVALLLPLSTARAQEEDTGKLQLFEQTIKAGLIYNFLKYTDWPGVGEKSRLRVCLLGGGALSDSLAPLEGKTAQESVISIAHVDKVSDTSDCSVVFIDSGQKENVPALLSFTKGRHILTVSDADSFARQGGMVELATENNRVALYINKTAVDHAGLSIQDRLLKLAKLVSS